MLIIILFLIILITILIINFNKTNFNNSKIESINFAYPSNKFNLYESVRDHTKTHLFSNIIPGKSKYNFNEEIDYMSHYSKCYYALTYKKAGWDCLRHYEIIAAGCIPYFIGIDNIPETIMKTYPKKLIKEAMNIRGLPDEKLMSNYIKNNVNLYLEIPDDFDYDKYYKLRNEILKYFKEKCLTNTLINNLYYKKSYVICNNVNGPQDYMRDIFIISLLENNQYVYTNFDNSYIFNDYEKNTTKLYGKGMTYTKCLDKSLKKNYRILNDIDIKFEENSNIIFTTKSNKEIPKIQKYKLPNKNIHIYELDGNDFPNDIVNKKTYKKFIRELK